MTTRHQERQQLLAALQANGSPDGARAADTLRELYHAQEMAGLSHDSYDAAKKTGESRPGWARVSAEPARLRELLPSLGFDDEQIRELLHPSGSGFRAEIYIPDPAVLGPGFKPTLVFKGSRGEIVEDGRLRDTTIEDFVGNNLPQSLGLETDYYRRSMQFGLLLKEAGLDFDIAGHSLGGGKGSAASAVTGMRAVTFNAAGLHPNTAKTFSEANGHIPIFDTDKTVTAWQVQGEILNDGVQAHARGMGDLQAGRMAMLLSNTAEVLQRTPAGRDYLEQQLLPSLPTGSHPAVREMLQLLQQDGVATLIHDVPEAAGTRRPPLQAMARDAQGLVTREDHPSLAELHQLGGPVLTVLAMGARGANVGADAGQVIADGGQAVGRGIEVAGDATRQGWAFAGDRIAHAWTGAGVVLGAGTHALGEFNASARMAGAHIDASLDHAQGWAQHTLAQVRGGLLRGASDVAGTVSDTWRDTLDARAGRVESAGEAARDRNRDEAVSAIGQGRADAQERREAAGALADDLRAGSAATGTQVRTHLVYVGAELDAGLEVVDAAITRTTSHAPTAGAGLGGVTGIVTGGALTFDPRTPHGVMHWAASVELVREFGPAIAEAADRHGMEDSVLPSLERHVAEQEAAARALLQEDLKVEAPALQAQAALLSGGTGDALERLFSAVRQGDPEALRQASSALMETPGAQAWLADGQARLVARDHAEARAPEAEAHHAPHLQESPRSDDQPALAH